MNIEIVEKNETNAKLIMGWRNDEVTRKMSFNSNLKIWGLFKDEFYDNYFNNIIPPLFAILNGIKVGIIGFADNNENKEHNININIAPEYRCKKLGTQIINKAIQFVKKNYNYYNKIIAHIKEKNIPSIKTFEKCGFTYYDKYIKNCEIILKYRYNMKNIKIGNKTISPEHPTFFIAELSCNHNQNYDIAIQLIHEAYKAGADAVKLQTYTPDTMTLNSKKDYFKIKGTIWENQYLYDLYKQAYTPWEWHKGLKEEANKLGMELFSSPFDTTAVDFLEQLDVPAYKIASFEITDHILIKRIAQTKKPVIISSGMASKEELQEAIDLLRKHGTKDICMLKCTSAYPAKPEDANLITMKDMAQSFDVIPGLSDHTLGIEVPVASVALGAKVIEKHFTLSRESGSPDDAFSLTPDEFKQMVDSVRIVEKSIGKVTYGGVKTEEECKKFRRSLFVCKDIKKGEEFTPENIKSVRPGCGLHTKYYEEVLGKKAIHDIEFGEPLSWNMIE
jgi:pseudaminic acid synthase